MADKDPFAEAAKYFGKKKAGRDPLTEKLEDAAGIGGSGSAPGTIKPAEVQSPKSFTPAPKGLIPLKSLPEKQSSLQDKSLMGSGKMSQKELKQGFRKIGVKLNYSEDGK